MQILIKSVQIDLQPQLEGFIRDKVGSLEKFNDRIVRAHVTLSVEQGNSPQNKSCEILLSLPGEDPFLKKTGASFEEAIAGATSAMEELLRRKKVR
ncbi:MAG TPA: HPF/RaiA family ribosome-associated protein [Cyclobacteriaceae bacterium]|nr:ribosome-associated translation inhibitor RaiA [Cyclobacteriaceae bacterium]MCB9236864.1 ribosome-associated translation inhibitor RaiA [Flammeovirgaceae bacterium]MCB0498569.1 ribosome-associated translation inhibitor RaiA [Cyclobacteriaceae bacterium]MCO5271534.1 HPF/RaiA family ribosome-associated protein [Cyclobacteriaceae bacterium]MCW5901429.1 ribosome-associated translation inhibitor RaiA [Cyclobacteriaceae bacterium]